MVLPFAHTAPSHIQPQHCKTGGARSMMLPLQDAETERAHPSAAAQSGHAHAQEVARHLMLECEVSGSLLAVCPQADAPGSPKAAPGAFCRRTRRPGMAVRQAPARQAVQRMDDDVGRYEARSGEEARQVGGRGAAHRVHGGGRGEQGQQRADQALGSSGRLLP